MVDQLTRKTGMHHKHVELGAVMAERDGWQRPLHYTDAERELSHLKQGVGLCDVSPQGKLSLQGAALDVALPAVLQDYSNLKTGAVQRYALAGPTSAPVTVARLADDEAMVLTEVDQAGPVGETMADGGERCAHVVDVTSGLAAVRLAGPLASSLLASLTELDVYDEAFANMSCAQARFDEVLGTVLRIDIGEVAAYDLYFGRHFGEYMWDALTHAGEEYELIPVGVDAMARLEA